MNISQIHVLRLGFLSLVVLSLSLVTGSVCAQPTASVTLDYQDGDVLFTANEPIAGFQFVVTGDIVEVCCGAAEEAEFMILYEEATGVVLSFSMDGQTISAPSGVLIQLAPADACVSIDMAVVSTSGGEAFDVTWLSTSGGDCDEVVDCIDDCPGDLNNDGAITTSDVLLMLAVFGTLCE